MPTPGDYTADDWTPEQWKAAWNRGAIGQNTGLPTFPPTERVNSRGDIYNPARVGAGGVNTGVRFPRGDEPPPAVTPAAYKPGDPPPPAPANENINDPTPPSTMTPGQYSPTPWGHPQIAAIPRLPPIAAIPRLPRERLQPLPTPDTLTPPPDKQGNRYWNPVGQQQPFAEQINRYAHEYGVPPNLLSNLLRAESNFNPRATGPMTKYGQAEGIAQFIPQTAQKYHINPYDPDQGIRGAANYLRDLYNQKGTWAGAVAAYNGAKSIDVSQYRGSPEGRALIANAAALDGGLVKAGPLVPPPQNYRPVSYTPRGGYPSMFPDRPSSMWGKDSPGMFEGPGAIPHQREIGGILGGIAPFLMIGLALFSKGAALPMLSAYAGYQTARNQRRDKDAKELKTQYRDHLAELKARMQEEQIEASGAMGDPQALQEIALRYGDSQLQAVLANGGDPSALFQARDRAYQDVSKTALAEAKERLAERKEDATEDYRNAMLALSTARTDEQRKTAEQNLADKKAKLNAARKAQQDQEKQFPGSTSGGGESEGQDGQDGQDGGQQGGGQHSDAGGGNSGEDGGDGEGGGAPAASPASSTTSAPEPAAPAPEGGGGSEAAPSGRWGPGGPPPGYNPKDDPMAPALGSSAAPSSAPAAPAPRPRAQKIAAPGGEDQVIPSGNEPRVTPATDTEPPTIPPVPAGPSQAAIEDAENNTLKLGRTFLHGGESPPGMRPGVNQAAEVVANNLRTALNGIATSGITGQPLLDAIRKIDNRTADLVDQVSHNRAPLPGGQGMGSRLQDYSQMISQLAIAANPQWDAGQWRGIETFRDSSGQTQRAIGRITAIGDAGTKLKEDLDAIKDDPTVFGRMLNQFKTQGFTDDPAYSNLFTDWQTFIIDSNALTQGGQGLEGETEQMIKSIPLYGQKSAYVGALKRHASFALKRYQQYQNQWSQYQRTDPMFGHNDDAAKQLQDLSDIKEGPREKLPPSTGWGATGAPQ